MGVLLSISFQVISKAVILLIMSFWHLKTTKQSNGQVGKALERSFNPEETRLIMVNDYLKKSANVKALLAYLLLIVNRT